MARSRVVVDEVRVLDGPNLYFPRPALKLTLGIEPWLAMDADRFEAAVERIGSGGRIGEPDTDQRRRAVARMAAHLTKRLAGASDIRLGVRSRPGPEPDQVVVSFPWRRLGTAKAAGTQVARLLDAALDGRRSVDRLLAEAATRVSRAKPGD